MNMTLAENFPILFVYIFLEQNINIFKAICKHSYFIFDDYSQLYNEYELCSDKT